MDIASMIWECRVKPKTYALVTRKTWREVKNVFDSHIKLADPSKVSKVDMVYHFPNGSKLFFGLINDKWHIEKHQGMYYDYMDVDSIESEYAAQLLKRIRPSGT